MQDAPNQEEEEVFYEDACDDQQEMTFETNA